MRYNKTSFFCLIIFCLNSSISIRAQDFLPKKGTLAEINNAFHADYNFLVKQTIDSLGNDIPVIIFIGDSLVLKYKSERHAERVVPDEYHNLKSLDHLALGIFVTVSRWKEGALTEEDIELLQKHERLAQSALKELPDYTIDKQMQGSQALLVNKCISFLQQMITNKKYVKRDRNLFARQINSLLMANTDRAAKMELNNLHEQMQHWKKTISEEAFKRMYVVVGSSHQARYKALAVQYFDYLLLEKTGSTALTENRLVFAEAVYSEAGCLSVLARHIIDQEIGLQFFGDRYRMQKDLLSESASTYLKQLFPSKNNKKGTRQ